MRFNNYPKSFKDNLQNSIMIFSFAWLVVLLILEFVGFPFLAVLRGNAAWLLGELLTVPTVAVITFFDDKFF